MIYTYYMDITPFENEKFFREKKEMLSPYRQQKLALLKHEKDKNRSLAAGTLLNHALSVYGLQEREMEYEFGEWGKPSFKYYPEIHFSLSHSGDFCLCSIGDRPVGNDIERIRQGRTKVADRFFAKEELDWLYAAEDEKERERRMFRIWTMKESFLKVTGRGMSLSLKDFAVCMDEEHQKIRVKHEIDAKYYHMREYEEIEGYCVSVCCQESKDLAYSMICAQI
jgi:4'-phosphopantetheinyl transferase